MATQDLVKIALKSTANMSLNERFQLLRQNQMRRQNNTNNAFNSNKSVQNNNRLQLRQGSQKNRRLALQMANRPSVLAALRAQNNQNSQPIKQRLGIKRFNNQTINRNNNNNNNNINRIQTQKNRNRNPINRLNFNSNGLNRNRINNQNTVQTQNRRNNYQNIGVIVGVRRKASAKLQNFKQKKNRLRRTQAFKPMANAMRTGVKPKRKVGQQIRNQNQAKPGIKRGFRINRNFSARTNSLKQTQLKRRNVKPNREQLDNDLDAYMAGTKSHLDAELDAYMAQTN